MNLRAASVLVGAIAISELAGALGAIFTVRAIPDWYATLAKPPLTPPGWVFGLVWTLLYLLMGIAAFLVWRRARETRAVRGALLIFAAQLVLNALWSFLFFGLRLPLAAFAEIIVLWCAIAWTLVAFFAVSRRAAWLLVPYLLWTSFAAYLNFGIMMLNAPAGAPILPAVPAPAVAGSAQNAIPTTTGNTVAAPATTTMNAAFVAPKPIAAAPVPIAPAATPSATPIAPTSTPLPAATTAAATPTSTTLPPATIAPQSIVGLLCHYRSTDPSSAGTETLFKGSGVIVSPQGYILTAKHIVDPAWTAWAYSSTLPAATAAAYRNLVLDHCEVGLPEMNTLPTADEIKSVNPSTQLQGAMQYEAVAYFDPSRGSMSDLEYRQADFAVLKITTTTPDCAMWHKDCNDFGRFPYDAALARDVPPSRTAQVLDYGYPAELINEYGTDFNLFYLKGAVGYIDAYYGGDQYFKDQPFDFHFVANDIQGGRSGSPLFWNGYLVGIFFASDNGSTQSGIALGMPAIYRLLEDSDKASVVLPSVQ